MEKSSIAGIVSVGTGWRDESTVNLLQDLRENTGSESSPRLLSLPGMEVYG
jgi:hypothetical protein